MQKSRAPAPVFSNYGEEFDKKHSYRRALPFSARIIPSESLRRKGPRAQIRYNPLRSASRILPAAPFSSRSPGRASGGGRGGGREKSPGGKRGKNLRGNSRDWNAALVPIPPACTSGNSPTAEWICDKVTATRTRNSDKGPPPPTAPLARLCARERHIREDRAKLGRRGETMERWLRREEEATEREREREGGGDSDRTMSE